MEYTTLSLAAVRAGLQGIAEDAQQTFGDLTAVQLNWQADAGRWSVAQCFEHLVTSDRLMWASMEQALGGAARTFWQRLPFVPGLLGRLMVRSLGPGGGRKFTAPAAARPGRSSIPADVVVRFVDQHRKLAERVAQIDEAAAGRVIMSSPFSSLVVYTVLDGCRLMLAHDRRHFEQAQRVVQAPGFPAA